MHTIVYYKGHKRKRSLSPFYITCIVLACVILVWGYCLFYNKNIEEISLISPLAQKTIHNTVTYMNSRENSKELGSLIQEVLGKDIGNYAVVVKNLKSGERYYVNEQKPFETASLYKLWVMAVAFQKIESKQLSESFVLTGDVADLNEKFNISSESAELTEGTVSWPVKNALEEMITISDNYSALLLAEKMGTSSISNFLSKYDLSQSKIGTLDSNPMSTAYDIASFLEKLYDGEFASKESTEKMIVLLKKQTLNTKLPRNLPKNTIVAHKTGELGEFSHDAGIVYTKNGDYVIVVMSKTSDPLLANEKIADISEKVFNYFEK